MSSFAIEFDDVWRHFADHAVLRGLTFGVEPGEVFALLGRNGAGKTTALRVLLGFLAPHHGKASVLGRDSARLEPTDRDRIGYVAEGHQLYGEMRIAEAIDFEAGTRPRFARKVAAAGLARCGLDGRRRIGLLSRGQRAQVALLLAAAGQPDLLVFDDPAMGLDVAMRRELLDVLIGLLAERGCAVLFSTHILTDVERMADRVGILHGGRLIVNATLDDLKTRVQKRHWVGTNGQAGQPPEVAGLLRAKATRHGFDLTLLDCGAERAAALRTSGVLADPVTPDLEELFLDLTTAPAQDIWTVDPIVITGRPWLVGPGILLHALLALALWRHLRRLGASTRRATAWSLAAGFGGCLVFALVAGIETQRAYRRRDVAKRAPDPVILSA